MGKQYKTLTDKDIKFLKAQKLFYIASSSGKEVNLSPKGYDSIRVIDNSTLLYLGYPGSGNRTCRDAKSDGEFTLVFNSFDEKPMILRLFCKAKIVEDKSEEFYQYLKQFNEQENFIRNFFIFEIYAVELSCGETIPYMEYKRERNSLKEWMVKMDKNNKLEKYKEDHFTPRNMKNI